DTLPDFNEHGPKMVISGVIYNADSKTPAKDVVLYVYHTDQTGHYTNKLNEPGWPGRNGYIKGWMKTNEKGEYKFYTLKPAPYPGAKIPAHIHPVIKESDKNEYWIDEYLFDDDPLLTSSEKNKQEQHGGSGIIHFEQKNGMLIGTRNIILGRNIPNYPPAAGKISTGSGGKPQSPLNSTSNLQSGLAMRENMPAMDPYHITGPDKGTKTCPMCKYGRGQGIMVWWNSEDIRPFMQMMQRMDVKIQQSGFQKLRVFGIYMNPGKESIERVKQRMQSWIDIYGFQNVAILCIPSPSDSATAELYHINPSPEIENTIFIYKQRRVADKFINYNATSDTEYGSLLKLLM
ncbi:MAG: hypothetical protein ABJA79_10045, partial [Parafilimonas sp.]